MDLFPVFSLVSNVVVQLVDSVTRVLLAGIELPLMEHLPTGNERLS